MALSKQCVIYLSNICEIVTYHWPKETMLLMTNDNLLYLCFDHKIFVVHRKMFEIFIPNW
jgi:hypothetical protein